MIINNLTVQKNNTTILNDFNATFEDGKTHIIMGPNGCGKTTLSYSITKHFDTTIVSGKILFNGTNLVEEDTHNIFLNGVFLSPQYPTVINGLSHASFLKAAINAKLKFNNHPEMDEFEFLKLLRTTATKFQFDPKTYIRQSLNVGFSGGEKKRNEALQISLLKPKFIILDEIDSGLDLDAKQFITKFLNDYKKENPDTTILCITHQPDFAEALNPNFVHLMKKGKIIKTSDSSLIAEISENGFGDNT